MPIRRVWIEEGCIACNLSHDTCPAVFEIPPGSNTAIVKPGADLVANEKAIKEAAAVCPVNVIRYEESS
jgi:ferredoxin